MGDHRSSTVVRVTSALPRDHVALDVTDVVVLDGGALAFAAIGEAFWWFTIVNDTLCHNRRTAYDQRRR
jgi:hypothetical protein